MKKFGTFFLFLISFFIFQVKVSALSSTSLILTDWIYSELETLEAFGIISSAIHGQRPYSRIEVARQLIEAEKKFSSGDFSQTDSSFIRGSLDELNLRFQNEIQTLEKYLQKEKFARSHFEPIESASLFFTFLSSEPRLFPLNNGTGSIQAYSQSLVEFREGRNYIKGSHLSLETSHSADFTRYFSLFARPRFWLQFPIDDSLETRADVFLQEGYVVANAGNIYLKVGRSSLYLGQGEHGGLLLSSHARPLDQIVLGNDRPAYLPSFLKWLGPAKFTFFFSTLGPEYSFKNALFSGYKVGFKPFKIWEIGLSNAMTIGGEGAPDFSAWDFTGDFFGFSGTSNSKSNRIIGIDTRVTLPFLRHSQVYGEAFWDDKTIESFKRTLVDTSAYLLGFSVPRLNNLGSLSLNLELSYASEIFYRHFQFLDGYTLNGNLLGDPVGPDGRAARLKLGWRLDHKNQLFTQFYHLRSESNTYALTGTSSTVSQNNPCEKRWGGVLRWYHRLGPTYQLVGQGGYERVNDFNYSRQQNRNHLLGEVGLEFSLD